jgi:hypothetical protein
VIYLDCHSNKWAATVFKLFKDAIDVFGWLSRCREDFRRENNEVEQRMIAYWEEAQCTFLQGW